MTKTKRAAIHNTNSVDAPAQDLQWTTIQEGILERLEAVELFLADVSGRFRYESELSSSDPAAAIIARSRQDLTTILPSFRKRIWLASMDLTCDSSGQFWFVDDHFCSPYGLLRLQQAISNAAPNSTELHNWQSFLNAGRRLIASTDDDSAVVLGPTTFNTVYSENRFFADWLGLPYVGQRQLELNGDGLVRMSRGTAVPVNMVLRRLQDEDLDPNCFQTKSFQGVRGLVRAARRGQVSVFNAPGTGMFNDRSVTRLIPDLIRFYLGREPSLPTVPTLSCKTHSAQTIAQPENFVFRTGNSMDLRKPLVGSVSTAESRKRYLEHLARDPASFVARQTVESLTGNRHEAGFSLRTYCVGTVERTVLRGGLKRHCYSDGTPMGPVTQDESAQAFIVSSDTNQE